MKNKIIYLLKHNVVIQKLFKAVFSFFLRFLSLFVKVKRDIVLFVSFAGSRCNDSPKVIYDYLMSHDEFRSLKCYWAYDNVKFDLPYIVKIDSFKYFLTALKAKYWITNTNIERGLSFKRKKQVYLNTWHGIALKTIGNDCPGRKDYNFKSINYLCVSGKHDEQVFKSAFSARECSFLKCGMPRNDSLFNTTNEKKEAIKKRLYLPQEKKIILYAPTWRDSVDGGKSYQIKPPISLAKWKEKLSKDYIIIFRAHHLTTKVMDVKFDDFIIDMSNYSDINDLMIVADILITDYSAIAFDYSILERPIFVFGYDIDEYLRKRGTYFDIDDCYPNKVIKDENNLLDRLLKVDYESEKNKTKYFKEKFIQYGGNATTACVNAIFGDNVHIGESK